MKKFQKLVCIIVAAVCALLATSCSASAEKQTHIHSYIAISDESYFVTLNMDGERVECVDFYNAYNYGKTFSVEFDYSLWGRIKSAVTYQYYEDETIKGTDCTVKYGEDGKLAEIVVFADDFRVFALAYTENENGDKGYYLKYDGSASFFELNEDGLAKTMLYHVGDEYLTLFATYNYDGQGRLVEISATANQFSAKARFEYEGDSCCFSKMINDAQGGYTFTFERDEAHNAVKCDFVSKDRSFSSQFKYEGNRQIWVSGTESETD